MINKNNEISFHYNFRQKVSNETTFFDKYEIDCYI